MKTLTDFQSELEQFERQIIEAALPPEELQTALDRYEKLLARFQAELEEREVQNAKEEKLHQVLKHLEYRISTVYDEAKELESGALQKEAHTLHHQASRLMSTLEALKEQLLKKRAGDFLQCQEEARQIEKEVSALEAHHKDLLRKLDLEDQEASLEDEYPEKVRLILALGRGAEYYLRKGVKEYEHLDRRGEWLQSAQSILKVLPETPPVWNSPSGAIRQDYQVKIEAFCQKVTAMNQLVRSHLQDIHHLISEGIQDKDMEGAELSLPYAMGKHWKAGRKEEFYRRLWAMNFILLQDPSAPKELRTQVRGLLEWINGNTPEKNEIRRYANEGRKFLLLAGNGVIRRFLEESYDGLKMERDFARLGQDLSAQDPPQHLYLLQLAVNLPRLFDLSLNDRFGKIYEQRIRTKRVLHLSSYPEMRVTDDMEDLVDVPPEDLKQGWEMELLQGELPIVIYQEQTMDQVEVGHEKRVEAQLFVLDASGSMYVNEMHQPVKRWLLRNAIFLSALNTFSVDAAVKHQKKFENILFKRMFGSQVGPREQVKDVDQALVELKLFLNYAGNWGGTDLQGAIEQAYADIKEAKGGQKALKEATVIVVTDGVATEGFNIHDLLKAQKIEGTQVVTHVFAIEQENEDLRRLSRESGPGKAFYYFIKNAGDASLVAKPPYGTAEEFSPVWRQPLFKSPEEGMEFESEITTRCEGIMKTVRKIRDQSGQQHKGYAKELEKLLYPGGAPQESYEQDKNPREAERRKRRTARVKDILNVLPQLTDEKIHKGEVMELFRSLCKPRAVLPRDFRRILEASGDVNLRQLTQFYREKVYPRLENVE